MNNKIKVFTSSKSNEWHTPPELFRYFDDKFHFTLDAAATSENALCDKFCTKKNSGLRKPWKGEIVWCNPPYGGNIGVWVAKAEYECRAHGVTSALLITSYTSSRFWHEYIFPCASEIAFFRGRIKFSGADNTAPFSSVLVIFRPGDNSCKITHFKESWSAMSKRLRAEYGMDGSGDVCGETIEDEGCQGRFEFTANGGIII